MSTHSHNCSSIDAEYLAGGDPPTIIDDYNGYAYSNFKRFIQNFNVSGSITLTEPSRSNFTFCSDGLPEPRYFSKTYFTTYSASGTLTITPKVARFTFGGSDEIYVGITATPSGPFQVQGSQYSIQSLYGDRNANCKIRLYEPATGKWVEGIEHYDWGATGEGTDTWNRFVFTCSDSGENYTSPNVAGIDPPKILYATVDVNGVAEVRGNYGHTTSYAIFTPGNEIQVTITAYTDNGEFAFRHLEITGKPFSTNEFNELFPGCTSPDYLYDSVNNFNPLSMTGFISGPCLGSASGPVRSPVEMGWSSNGCDQHNGLRWSTSGDYGRHGFFIGDASVRAYYMITDDSETEPYVGCNPDGDYFIQSYFPDLGGNYSTYALKASDDSIFAEGMLEAIDMNLTFNTDRAEYNLTTGDDYYKLVGPKAFIDLGASGKIDSYYYYNNTTGPGNVWDPEPGWDTYVAISNQVNIDLGDGFEGFDMFAITSRSGTNALGPAKTVVDSKACFPAIVRVGEYHFVHLQLTENGSVYNRDLKLYKYDFTTDTISVVQTIAFSDCTRPCTFANHGNALLFVASHGSYDGRLYVGDPEWDDSKTDQGRVAVYDFVESTSTLTFNQNLTRAVKAGYEGSCIGHGAYYDTIQVGMEDDIVAYDYSGGSYSNGLDLTGDKDTYIGRCFSMGSNYLIAFDIANSGPEMWQTNNVSWTRRSNLSGGTSVPIPINVQPSHYGSSYYPVLKAWNGTSYYTFYWGGTTTISYTTSYIYAVSKVDESRETTNRLYGWYNSWLRYSDTQSYIGFGNLIGQTSDTWTDTPFSYNCNNVVMDNGSGEERLVHAYVATNKLDTRYHLSEIGTSTQDHVDIGKWYIYADVDLTGTSYIVDCYFNYFQPDVSCIVTFGFKPNNSSNYYTPNGSGGFNQYGTLELLRTNAASASLFASGMPNFSYNGATSLIMYFFLEKTLYPTAPLTTPGAGYIRMGLWNPGIPEPVICLHFNSNERIKEVYKTTGDILTVKTPNPPLSEYLHMVASGSFNREPFT